MDCHRIREVGSFAELLATPFSGDVNALCWRRDLAGDFAEVMALAPEGPLDEEALRGLRAALTAAGQQAVDIMREDLRLLREAGLDPLLDHLKAYPRDMAGEGIPTDVYSFHVDRAPVMADTWLCTYAGAASEGLPNEQAVRHVDIPETRARLRALFERESGEDFDVWLGDNCYDLHYTELAGAQPYNFGRGNLWRIAIEWPGCPVPPCIHRAPDTLAPRLLLIS